MQSQKHRETHEGYSHTFESYSQDLATGLSVCSEIANLLIQEHPCWHQDLVNSQRRDPHLYSVRDIVFACRATRLNI